MTTINSKNNFNTATSGAPGGLRRLSALGLLVTMGIVFGDIGTSPLYVMKAIVGVNPSFDADYIVGAVSCVDSYVADHCQIRAYSPARR